MQQRGTMGDTGSQSKRAPALLALAFALFSWGMAPVFIRFMKHAYDPYSQSFIRYFFAALVLTAVCLVMFRAEFFQLLRRPGPLLGIVFFNTVHQLTWTAGCYRASATLAQLIIQIGVVFVIIFSYLLFHEERRVIRSPFYLAGTVFSFLGMAVVVTGGRHTPAAVDALTVALLVIPALCWAVYVVWAKHLVTTSHPVPLFAVLALFNTLGTGLAACVLGNPACVVEASAGITFVALLSGILPLAAAHPAFHYAQRHLGSAFSSSCNLFSPLVTYACAAFFLDDVPLTLLQWSGAVVLISGTMMVVQAGKRMSGSRAPGGAAQPQS